MKICETQIFIDCADQNHKIKSIVSTTQTEFPSGTKIITIPMKAKIHITLKPGILDPEGKTIQHALHTLGFSEVSGVRAGKLIEMELGKISRSEAERLVDSACSKLLTNPVIEDYSYTLIDD